jgi:hypothetical protein
MMHPYLIGAYADERQAQMLANAEIARRAHQAGSEHRRAHIKAVPCRWARRITLWRIQTLPAAQIRLQETRPPRRAAGAAPAP